MNAMIRALEIFRHHAGIIADPERNPILWTACLEQAAEELEYEAHAMAAEEGGEG